MPVYRIQVRFKAASGLPKDDVTNTWHFRQLPQPGGGVTNPTNVFDMLRDFYQDDDAPNNAPGKYINNTMLRSYDLTMYNLEDNPPRVPVAESTGTLPNMGWSNILPSEVALVASFQAERQSGVNQARRRNRIYLGPLTTATANNYGPTKPMREDLATACNRMLDAANASIDWQWVVWSPTANEWALVDNGWVDDAWDTQRRRGYKAGSRELWP